MESPFDQYVSGKTVSMFVEPILNPYWKTYQNIITFSDIPSGPLSALVRPISPPRLSEFQTPSPYSTSPFSCTYALMRYPNTSKNTAMKHADSFMYPEDIPAIISYMKDNGYIIDTQITKMIQRSDVNIGNLNAGKKRMILIAQCPP